MKLNTETYVVFVSFITSFFAVFLSAGIILGVPSIASEFQMNNVIQNWIPTIAMLVVAVFTLPAGQLSGKYGVKKSLIAGVVIFIFAGSKTTKQRKSIRLYSNRNLSCRITVSSTMRISGL